MQPEDGLGEVAASPEVVPVTSVALKVAVPSCPVVGLVEIEGDVDSVVGAKVRLCPEKVATAMAEVVSEDEFPFEVVSSALVIGKSGINATSNIASQLHPACKT